MSQVQGKMIIVTAPSGAGKTTIVRHLLQKFEALSFSVSATTRPQRHYETDGKDYYFLSRENFEKRRDAGEFLEWEEVYSGSYYGTLKMEVERLWKQDKCVIFDVDVKGALAIKSQYEDNALTVFISPPGLSSLEDRLRNRNTENAQSFKLRIDRAREEMSYSSKFDYVLVNDRLEEALTEAEALVEQFLHKRTVEKAED